MKRLQSFIQAQTRIRWDTVFRMTAGILLAALLMGPLTEWIDAQQATVTVPTAAAASSALMTMTTTLTTPVVALMPGFAGTLNTGFLIGNHTLYGYRMQGTSVCYVRLYDTWPAAAVTAGTTVPRASFLVDSSSALGWTISPIPIYSMTSGLVYDSASTPGGSGACSTAPVVTLLYK